MKGNKGFFNVLMYGLGMLTAVVVLGGLFVLISVSVAWVMSFCGFKYESFGSMLCFFAISGLISLPLEGFAIAFPLHQFKLGNMGKLHAMVMTMGMDVIGNYIAMSMVNLFTSKVTATSLSIIVASLCMAPFTLSKERYAPSSSE